MAQPFSLFLLTALVLPSTGLSLLRKADPETLSAIATPALELLNPADEFEDRAVKRLCR
jgi:hypothetical protein